MNSVEYRELRQLVERRFGTVDQRFESIDRRFNELEANLRAEIRSTAAETRAHFDIVAEKFRGDVKTIGEGYANHTTVLSNHEARLQQLEQARLKFE